MTNLTDILINPKITEEEKSMLEEIGNTKVIGIPCFSISGAAGYKLPNLNHSKPLIDSAPIYIRTPSYIPSSKPEYTSKE